MSLTSAPAYAADETTPQASLGYPVFKGEADPIPASGVSFDPSQSQMARIFAQDLAQGAGSDTAHDFWMDRMLARNGAMHDETENRVAFTRGRAAFMKVHDPAVLGWGGDLAYWESLGHGGAYEIVLSSGGQKVALSEEIGSRKQTPSYYQSVFTGGGLRLVHVKYMTHHNVLVSGISVTSTDGAAHDVHVEVTSGHAATGAGDELTGSEKALNNVTTVKPRLSGNGLSVDGRKLVGTLSVPAAGSTELKVQMGLITEENPESLNEYEAYKAKGIREAYTSHVTTYNKWWADNLVYLDTPENNIDKTLFYRWWLMRYNFLDADVPGNDYQFPTSMEGVLGYNNAIVLTVGMFIDDLKYFRDPVYSYGPALSVGETSKSKRFIDNPGDPANWSQSYTQYITEAAWKAYQVHGGPGKLGDPLARHGEEDVTGLIRDFDSNHNYLIEYNWAPMTGNDADAVSFDWQPHRKMDRAESAYLYSNAMGAAHFYEVSGNTEGARRMKEFAGKVRASVLSTLWEDATQTPDAVGLKGNLLKHSMVHDGSKNPWKEINNYYPFTVGLMPKAGDADYDPKYVEALRLFADAKQYPVFPFYTANQVDKAAAAARGFKGSNNFSVINSDVWFRMLSSVLRDYPSQYVTPEMYKQLLYWNAWSHYQDGDNRMPNQNEFWAKGSAANGGKIDYRSWIHHTILGTTNFTMIEDAMGLRPRADEMIELAPVDIGWDYFAANNISYHGHDLSIVWDKDGSHYGGGAGYTVYVDGAKAFTVKTLSHVIYNPATGSVSAADGSALDASQIVTASPSSMTPATSVSYEDSSRVVDIFAKAGTDISSATGGAENLARSATVSATYSTTERDASSVNDGTTANEPFWGSAGSTNATDSLELDLGGVKTVDDVRVYFYRSSSSATAPGYAAPQLYTLESWNGSAWEPVTQQARTPVYPQGNYNRIQFPARETSKLRLTFTPKPGAAVGVKEVQVYGTGVTPPAATNAAPKVSAEQDTNYSGANRVRLMGTAVDDGQPAGKLTAQWSVVSSPEGSQVIFENDAAAETVVRYTHPGEYVFRLTVSDGELEGHADVTVSNKPDDTVRDNIALRAKATASTVTGWNKIAAINDGEAPYPVPNESKAWGTWGQKPGADGRYTATLTWESAQRIDSSSILFHDDGGGVLTPKDWKLEYQDADGTWKEIENHSGYTSTKGKFNTVSFDAVTTRALRVSIARNGTGNKGYPGIVEWQVFPEKLDHIAPVAVRTMVDEAPTLPTTVEGVYANGDRVELPVTWAPIQASQYANEGTFTVPGILEGSPLIAEATVTVRPNNAVTINTFAPVSARTTAGHAPSLPRTVTATYNDGSTATVAVTWDEISADRYASAGTFEVQGSVEGTDKKPVATVTVVAATTALPVVEVSTSPTLSEGQWSREDVVVSATARDEDAESGERAAAPSIRVQIDDGAWADYDDPITVSDEGKHTLRFRAVASDGRSSKDVAVSVPIDKTAPVVTSVFDEAKRTLALSAKDAASGVASIEYKIGDGEWTAATSRVLIREEATVFYRATDRAGNVSDIAEKHVGAPTNDWRPNIAPEARPTVSHVTTWNSAEGLNDWNDPMPVSAQEQKQAWGTYNFREATQEATLTWEKARTVDTSTIRFMWDGGGMRVPKSWKLEYLDADGNWKAVDNPSGYTISKDAADTLTHTPVTTTALRVTLEKPEDGYVGIVEWEVYEAPVPAPQPSDEPSSEPTVSPSPEVTASPEESPSPEVIPSESAQPSDEPSSEPTVLPSPEVTTSPEVTSSPESTPSETVQPSENSVVTAVPTDAPTADALPALDIPASETPSSGATTESGSVSSPSHTHHADGQRHAGKTPLAMTGASAALPLLAGMVVAAVGVALNRRARNTRNTNSH